MSAHPPPPGPDPRGICGENVTYAENGTPIYTDPKTHSRYTWNATNHAWVPNDPDGTPTHAPQLYDCEHYAWNKDKSQWIMKAEAAETEFYKWNVEKGQWVLKPEYQAPCSNEGSATYDIDEDGHRIFTDADGAVYFWDTERNAWFPKIDDDFMARYQMNYGFIDNTSAAEEEKRQKEEQEAQRKELELKRMTEEANASTSSTSMAVDNKRKAAAEPPKWFDIDPAHNTKVYVSNLPLDITLDEFAELMGKCGMIMRDPKTQKYKLKLYAEPDGQLKGDGLCDYIKVESVDLALSILDEYDVRGHKIRVQRAKFEMRGEYNPALKPKRKKKDKEKLAKMKEKLFDWRPEKMRGERSKNEKVVIIKNLFHPSIFEKEVQLILDYQNDVREECSKCGTVRKVVIYDCHPEGVAQVNMSSPEEADLVIQMMQGRFFGQRQLSAEHWDGKTKYKIIESETEVQKRLNNWDQFLETEEEQKQPKSDGDDDDMPKIKGEIGAEAAKTALTPSESDGSEILQSKSEAVTDASDATPPLVETVKESKKEEYQAKTTEIISESTPPTNTNFPTIEGAKEMAGELDQTTTNDNQVLQLRTVITNANTPPPENMVENKAESCRKAEGARKQDQQKAYDEDLSDLKTNTELQSESTTLPLAEEQP